MSYQSGLVRSLSIGLVCICISLGIGSFDVHAQSIPMPRFFGVYALYEGKLTELKRNPHSNSYESPIAGQDIIHTISNITFPDSKELTFIIFSQRALGRSKYSVHEMQTIRNAQAPAFHLQAELGYQFRMAPVPNQPQMVQLVGQEHGTPGGHFALMLDDGFYDYQITGRAPSDDHCVERLVSSFMQVVYQPCRASTSSLEQMPGQEPTGRPIGSDAIAQSPHETCKVIPPETKFRMVTPYEGGCKDGLAEGQGTFTYFVSGQQRTIKGEFRDGKINGNARVTHISGYNEGEYRDNRPWNVIVRGKDTRGVPFVSEWRNGVFIGER